MILKPQLTACACQQGWFDCAGISRLRCWSPGWRVRYTRLHARRALWLRCSSAACRLRVVAPCQRTHQTHTPGASNCGFRMNPAGFLAVGVRAALGAWIRWWLGVRLNPLFLQLPLGTLVANLLGGYLIGVAVAYFAHHGPAARSALVSGDRFSRRAHHLFDLSAEVVMMISAAQYGWALATASAHLVGSLLMTGLGIVTFQWLRA